METVSANSHGVRAQRRSPLNQRAISGQGCVGAAVFSHGEIVGLCSMAPEAPGVIFTDMETALKKHSDLLDRSSDSNREAERWLLRALRRALWQGTFV